MKAVYTLRVRPGVLMPVPPETPPVILGDASIEWQVKVEGDLEAVIVSLHGAEVRLDERGTILSTYPELEDRAYALAVYLSNRIRAQTAFDAIDPETVFAGSPVVSPEGAEEERLFEERPKTVWVTLAMSSRIYGLFEPGAYASGFEDAAAYGYYAGALRSADVFQQFELFCKVVEHFFAEEGPGLDLSVSTYVSRLDSAYTPEIVEELRSLRNRSTHPRARHGHVGPHERAHVREMRDRLPMMRRLSELLLEHPK